MKIAITDSGLGGLSVCALLANHLTRASYFGDLTIKYVNAVPTEDLGYNQMKTRDQKVRVFNDALKGIHHWYQPDQIFVACNSLSVLMHDTPFIQNQELPVAGIVDVGVSLIREHLEPHPNAGVILLATDTTIEEQTYSKRLMAAGIDDNRIISQPCTGLATMISNDPNGNEVYQTIKHFVAMALLQRSEAFDPLYAFLGCTHYGYRKALFEQAFEELGLESVIVLNPNEHAYPLLIPPDLTPLELYESDEPPPPLHLSIEFVSRYPLPESEIETLSRFLTYSPETVDALQNPTVKPDLF